MTIDIQHTKEKPKYYCYECGEPVTLDELLIADKAIEQSLRIDEIASYFTHCSGPDNYFHTIPDEDFIDLVNVCPSCLQRLFNLHTT